MATSSCKAIGPLEFASGFSLTNTHDYFCGNINFKDACLLDFPPLRESIAIGPTDYSRCEDVINYQITWV